jgi:hypothetical protein
VKGVDGNAGSVNITRRGGEDNDGDGYSTEEGDCDDYNPDVNPVGYEGPIYPPGGGLDCTLCSDGLDNDCDGQIDLASGGCGLCNPSPIVLDILGDGFNLTSVADGVIFDLRADGAPWRYSWIQDDDAWLCLDRNQNGFIDNGAELFGNGTVLRSGVRAQNGFVALAEFDLDLDSMITAADRVFTELRLWSDANHNGVSESDELSTLSQNRIAGLDLNYRDSRRRDRHGNLFRFRAKYYSKLTPPRRARVAYDVYLAFERPQ